MNLPDVQDRATVTVAQAGELLGLKRSSAYEAARRGEIPTLRLGRRLLVPVPALMRLLGADPVSNGLNRGAKAQVGGASPEPQTGGGE